MAKDDNDEKEKNGLDEAIDSLKNTLNDIISNGNKNGAVDVEITVEKTPENTSEDNGPVQAETVTEVKPKEKKAKKERIAGFGTIIPVEQTLPAKLFVVGINGHPIFPGIFTPFMISNQEDVKTIEKAFETDGYIGIVLSKEDMEKINKRE